MEIRGLEPLFTPLGIAGLLSADCTCVCNQAQEICSMLASLCHFRSQPVFSRLYCSAKLNQSWCQTQGPLPTWW